MSRAVHQLRQAALAQAGADLTDGQLLENFVSRGDRAALEALVRRHGAMVWGVCRRLLAHHDAEDAFQATFLVLVRKAVSILPREMVGNWLYGVAHHAALSARTRLAKRRTREVQVTEMPQSAVAAPDLWDDVRPLLDQELTRLPDRYRVVVVLCDLEGKTRKEAARQLGLPEGTVASRLARARAMLAKRLARHGLGVSGGALAAVLSQKAASASVPSSVVSSTIKAASLLAAGQAAAGLISAKVAALTEGVLKGMLLYKLKTVAIALLVVAAVASAGGLLYRTQAAGASEQQIEPAAARGDDSAQDVRAIINQAIKAQGGETNLAKLRIVRQKGTYRRFIDTTQGKTLFSWETITQEPDRFKNVQQGEIDGQKMSMTILFKGNQGWISMDGQTQEMDQEMVASTKEDLYADRIASLLPLKGKEYQLSLLAEAMVNGRPAVGVKVAAKGRPDLSLFFDKETGLLAKRERRVADGMGGHVTEIFFFSDYQETAKVKVARKIATFADDKHVAELRISEVEFLDKVEDKAFDPPATADTLKRGKNDDPAPRPARETKRDDKPIPPKKPDDLKWRPARVAGPPGRYLVLVDPGSEDEFLPAAEAVAALHDAEVKRFDPAKLDGTLAELRKSPARFVVFVLPPEKIDVDLSHAILEMATKVDDDPFVDFEYGFVTGRDGAAALRFVRQIEQAWKRDPGDKAILFGSWEGPFVPVGSRMSGLKALGLTATARYIKAKDAEETRLKAARNILADCKGGDALIFMSHGYPDRMDLCFTARDLRDWKVDLSPAILFNCACFNGAPGRWFEPTGKGYADRGIVARDESVALALLDTGIAGYFAGIDTWHGPLTSQVFYYVMDDGMRLGEAANAMFNRLALEFLPDRIHFEPMLKRKRGSKDWWVQNQRDCGAAMILYGDPALAPFAKRAKHLMSARAQSAGKDRISLKIEVRPLVDGQPGEDFFVLPSNRLFDYYSLRSDPEKSSPQLELYRVVPLPRRFAGIPSLQVVEAKSGDKDIPTGTVQTAVEDTPDGKLLHVRVPVRVSLIGENLHLMRLAKEGLTVALEGGSK
jgi:RNA polymerase sigma factor (sigma-70 family)